MKIVIDIPKNYYNDLMTLEVGENEHLSYEMEMIRNGTQLPKGHGRLIDADDLISDLIFPTKQFEEGFKELIGDAPTIIDAESE